MMQDWTDPRMAQEWSANPTGHNPTREEQLNILISVLYDEYAPGDAILDIGMGSGIVEEKIFARIPDAYVVGVDMSEAMLDLARLRLFGLSSHYTALQGNLRALEEVTLPPLTYGVAISVQTIHNVEDQYKESVLRFVHASLKPGGLFLLLDRVALDTPVLFSAYRSLWRRLEMLHGGSGALHEGASYEDHRRMVDERGDLPITLEANLTRLRVAGFVEAGVLHAHGNRVLFAARKA